MRKFLARASVPMLVAGGIAAASVAVAAPASAGCGNAYYGVGVSQRCDDPVGPDGWFRRCDFTVVFGFGGTNCYMVNNNDLGPNLPRIP